MIVLSDVNPIAAFLWMMMTAGIAMFCFNPLLVLLSILGGLFYFLVRNPEIHLRDHIPYLLLFFASAILNPLFSHNGATVLFVLNNNPVTLEALYYGMMLGGMILSVLYWFRSFQQIMTGDKLLYVFGSALPKLTLMLSIALRYIPMLRIQSRKIREAQTALGLFSEENIIDRLRGEMRIFSVLVTWVLENGIITADSMSARGYGIGRRTRFALFRFRRNDAILCIACLLLGGYTIAAMSLGTLNCAFYPSFRMARAGTFGSFAYITYALLAIIPGLLEVEEKIRWKLLQSRT